MSSSQSYKQNDLISCEERDYLTEDPPIRGQNFACVSFLCPNEVIRNKEVFMFTEFVKGVGKDVAGMFESLEAKFGDDPDVKETLRSLRDRHSYLWKEEEMKLQYQQFKDVRADDLGNEFDKTTGFHTSTMGIKIRGVYDLYEQADKRAKMMHDFDDKKGNVFVTSVGKWCPWNPDPNAIADNHYAITELNTMMKKYNENLSQKDDVYEQRLRERRQMMIDETNAKKRKNEAERSQIVEEEGVDEDGKIAYDVWLEKQRKGLARSKNKNKNKKNTQGGDGSQASGSGKGNRSSGLQQKSSKPKTAATAASLSTRDTVTHEAHNTKKSQSSVADTASSALRENPENVPDKDAIQNDVWMNTKERQQQQQSKQGSGKKDDEYDVAAVKKKAAAAKKKKEQKEQPQPEQTREVLAPPVQQQQEGGASSSS